MDFMFNLCSRRPKNSSGKLSRVSSPRENSPSKRWSCCWVSFFWRFSAPFVRRKFSRKSTTPDTRWKTRDNRRKIYDHIWPYMENCKTKPKKFLTSGFSYQDIVARRSSRKTSYFYWKSCSYEDVFKIMIKSWSRNSRSKIFFQTMIPPVFMSF